MGKTQIGTSTIVKKMFGVSEVLKEVFNGATVYEKAVAGFKASVSGLGNQDPSSVVFTRDADFPTSFEEVTFNGDKFIKIPTMYRKIDNVTDGQITAFTMATAQLDGSYEPYPCFVAPDSSILPYVLIGKYCYSSTSAAGSTTSGSANVAIGTARTLAQTRGTGYQQYDWQIQKLFVDICLLVSQTVNFNSGVIIQNYLGVYNLDQYPWVDGLATNSDTWLTANNPANYVDAPTSSTTGYTTLSYAQPTTTSQEVMKLGYDANNAFANFPSTTVTNTSWNTYYCDGYFYSSGSHPVYSSVGFANAVGGLWHCSTSSAWTFTRPARLCYRPISS